MNNQAFSKTWILVIVVGIFAAGILTLWYLPKEKEEGLFKEIPFWKNPIEILAKPQPGEVIFDIFLKDKISGKETFLMQLDRVYTRHYHFAEYRNGNLYIIREFGYDPHTMEYAEDYIRELWKYDKEGKGEKLFSAKGIDFRVAPNEKFIAIESDNILRIIDLNTDEVKLVAPVTTLIDPGLSEDLMIGLQNWSGDGRFFWGDLHFTAYPQHFFRIDTRNWEIIKYNVSLLSLNIREFALNPNFGIFVYSDAPMVFDVESAEEFKKSGRLVNFYLYDLNTGKKKLIDTSIAEWFDPRWLDNDTIEYTKRGEKVSRKVDITVTNP